MIARSAPSSAAFAWSSSATPAAPCGGGSGLCASAPSAFALSSLTAFSSFEAVAGIFAEDMRRRTALRRFSSARSASYSVEKVEPSTEIGSASTRMPRIIVQEATNFPPTLVGNMSPYPTVVIVVMTHQKDSGIDMNGEISSSKGSTPERKYSPTSRCGSPEQSRSERKASISSHVRIL